MLPLSLALISLVSAQVITTYPTVPTVITVAVGTLQCTLWSQSPTPGFVQVTCCNDNVVTVGINNPLVSPQTNPLYVAARLCSSPLVVSATYDVTIGTVTDGFLVPSVGFVAWVFSPDPTPPAIDYQVTVGGQSSMVAPLVLSPDAGFWILQPILGLPMFMSGTF